MANVPWHGTNRTRKNKTNASESYNFSLPKSRKNSFLIQHILFQSIFFCSVALFEGAVMNKTKNEQKKNLKSTQKRVQHKLLLI